jgi:hypothetical protein
VIAQFHVRLAPALLLATLICPLAPAQPVDGIAPEVQPYGASSPTPFTGLNPATGLNEERIFGVLPNYSTVNYPTAQTQPLTVKQKWNLFVVESLDPFNLADAALGAGFSQIGNQTPKYGEGGVAYGKRYAAALGDFATQNLFSAGVLACLLHQDPRYFRMGPEHSVLRRLGYSVTRLVVARQDSGASAFNASGIFGMMLGIGASNLYYPSASVRTSVMLGRLNTSLTGGLIGNLTSEFWPDLQRILHKHHFPLT